MLTTIYLNDQTFFMAYEVNYIFTNESLTAELKTFKLSIFQEGP
jgi:hypothetical protein